MSRPLNLPIVETADELKKLMHTQPKAKLKERIHAFYLLKAGHATTLKEVADALGRSPSTIESWFRRYRTGGWLGLLAWNYHGGKRPAIPEPVLTALRDRLSQPHGFKSYGDIQQWLKDQYEVDIHYKTLHQTVHYKLNAKLKAARPTSLHRDDAAVVEFKKNSRPNLS